MKQVADTSIHNYHLNIKGEHENAQDEIVFEAVKKISPCTGRMIFRYLNGKIENSSVARSLNNLKKKHKKIICSFKDNCQITGVKAQYYTIIEDNRQTSLV